MRQCERKGWTLLSDTSWPGYEAVPARVMEGYTLIAHEATMQLRRRPPTSSCKPVSVASPPRSRLR